MGSRRLGGSGGTGGPRGDAALSPREKVGISVNDEIGWFWHLYTERSCGINHAVVFPFFRLWFSYTKKRRHAFFCSLIFCFTQRVNASSWTLAIVYRSETHLRRFQLTRIGLRHSISQPVKSLMVSKRCCSHFTVTYVDLQLVPRDGRLPDIRVTSIPCGTGGKKVYRLSLAKSSGNICGLYTLAEELRKAWQNLHMSAVGIWGIWGKTRSDRKLYNICK